MLDLAPYQPVSDQPLTGPIPCPRRGQPHSISSTDVSVDDARQLKTGGQAVPRVRAPVVEGAGKAHDQAESRDLDEARAAYHRVLLGRSSTRSLDQREGVAVGGDESEAALAELVGDDTRRNEIR